MSLHIAVVLMIGAGVLATTLLSAAIPGSASTAAVETPHESPSAQTFIASAAGASAEGQSVGAPFVVPQPPADNLLMAVLSLEASKSSAELEESTQRILELGVPQNVPPLASLKITAPEVSPTPASALAEEEDEDGDGEEEPDTTCPATGAYCIYTVVEGDTLSAIAQDRGFTGNESISAAEMLAQSNKPDVVSSDHIEPGQNLRIPVETGIVHTVLFAETAAEIASDYGVSLDAILSSPFNTVGADGTLFIGQEVFIPGPTQLPQNEEVELTLETPEPEATEVPTATTEPTLEPTPTETATLEPVIPPDVPQLGPLDTPTPVPSPTPEPTATPEPAESTQLAPEPTQEADDEPVVRTPSEGSFFIWPAVGPISSYFSPSHPLGIDIDLFDNPDAEIIASRAGEVVFAGGDPCCSYGLYVIIEHENGVQTLYAHLSAIRVREGQFVSQGQLLGIGGSTGYATGNHLHFEIRVNGNVVDPLKYLP